MIIVQAFATNDLWIWHSFFDFLGSHNDLNVLSRSPLFSTLITGDAPACNYSVNGHNYSMGYYLADGIYPTWAALVKTIPRPKGNKSIHFAQCHEAATKDVERAFRVLQKRFAIVRGPAEYWSSKVLWQIMTCCIILHNMIMEDERDMPENFQYVTNGSPVEPEYDTNRILAFLKEHRKVKNQQVHGQLQQDLIEHHWQRLSES
ncbi:hypothetical protein ACQJBY_039716 [Aegilops geniculata]